jgi:glutamyl-tRNA reductase
MQPLPLIAGPGPSNESCPEIAHLFQVEPGNSCLAPDVVAVQRHGSWGLVGLNHRTAPIELRSRVAMNGEDCRAFLRTAREGGLEECVVLSTCNRSEVYFAAGSADSVRHALSAVSGVPLSILRPHLYTSAGICGACHLVRVIAGLDSAVLGETEIASQVREAWRTAQGEESTGPMLDLLFRKALEAGKRIRSQTDLCRTSTSLAALAVRKAGKILGTLSEKHAIVIGAGLIGERTAKELAALRSCRITIVNRTAEKAHRLALSLKAPAEVSGFDDLGALLENADVVFCCIASDRPVLDEALFRMVAAARGERQLAVLDLGVPPNVSAAGLPAWVSVVNVDEIQVESAENESKKIASVSSALDIVEEELRRFSQDLIARSAAPVIRSLSRRLEGITAANLSWAEERLGHLSPKDWRVVEQLVAKLAKGVLESPIEHLKSAPPSESERDYIHRLFGLEEPIG